MEDDKKGTRRGGCNDYSVALEFRILDFPSPPLIRGFQQTNTHYSFYSLQMTPQGTIDTTNECNDENEISWLIELLKHDLYEEYKAAYDEENHQRLRIITVKHDLTQKIKNWIYLY